MIMDQPPAVEAHNGNVILADGPYYPVRFIGALPSVGDDIELFTLRTEPGEPVTVAGRVSRVKHVIHAVTQQHPKGHHFIQVHIS